MIQANAQVSYFKNFTVGNLIIKNSFETVIYKDTSSQVNLESVSVSNLTLEPDHTVDSVFDFASQNISIHSCTFENLESTNTLKLDS